MSMKKVSSGIRNASSWAGRSNQGASSQLLAKWQEPGMVNRRSGKRQRGSDKKVRLKLAPPARRSIVFWLGAAVRLFFVFRDVSRAQAAATERLKPAGVRQGDSKAQQEGRQVGRRLMHRRRYQREDGGRLPSA